MGFGALDDWPVDAEQLADLLVVSEDTKAFLEGLAVLGASEISRVADTRVECAVTLQRRKRPATIGVSSDKVMVLERIERTLEEGPSVEALTSCRPIILDDTLSSPQWTEYCMALSAAGMRSALAVPMGLERGTSAVMSFYAPLRGSFSRQAVARASAFAAVAGKALRLAIRITALNEKTADLSAAMKTRPMIDTACGVILAQNRCTPQEAFDILRKASNDRNQKLHDLARTLVAGVPARQQAREA